MTVKPKKKGKEEGSSALTALVALAALGLTSTYVLEQNSKLAMNVRQARSVENGNAINIANMNSLARIKSLLSTKKLNDGTYQPSLVAANYYEAKWNLAANSNQQSKPTQADLDGDKVKMKSVQIEDKSQSQVADIIDGKQSLNQMNFDDTMVEMQVTNFDDDKRLALSIDVKVISQQQVNGQQTKVESLARVPLAVPEPFNPILQMSPAKAEQWTTDFTNLQPGLYDIRVLASGIAFDATLEINGNPAITVGGFNLDGSIVGKANNYLARDAEVGRAEVSLGDGFGSQVNCKFIPLDQTFNIVMKVFGPAGGEALDANTKIYQVKTHGEVQGALTDAEYMAACNDQCPFIGPPDQADYDEKYNNERFAQGIYTDASHAHYMQEKRYAWNVADKKVCFNYENVNEEFKLKYGRDGVTWNELADEGRLERCEINVYTPGTCVKSFLFKRGTCGCFSDDTKILMGDGKTEKRITDLTQTDLVWNPMTKKAMGIARMTQGPEKIPMLEISAGGKSVKVTGKHPFPTPGGVRTAFTIQVGDQIRIGSDETWVKVDGVQALPVDKDNPPVVWNLELKGGSVEADHYVVADGVVTGDLYLQTQLEKPLASNK